MSEQTVWLYHMRADAIPVEALRFVLETFGIEGRPIRMTSAFDLPGREDKAVVVWSRSCRPLEVRTWLLKLDADMRRPARRRLAVFDLNSHDQVFLGYLIACGAMFLPITHAVAGLLEPCPQSFQPFPIPQGSPLRKTIRDHCGHGQIEYESVAARLSSIMPQIE